MPTYSEVYEEDTGKRRHYQRLMNGGLDGRHANGESMSMWVIIIASLVFLWLVKRGFRGVSAGGLMVGVK